jgi:hypothetical protein
MSHAMKETGDKLTNALCALGFGFIMGGGDLDGIIMQTTAKVL